MQVLCLQAVDNLAAEDIVKKINRKKLFKAEPAVALKEKGKVLLGRTKVKYAHQYSRQELVLNKGYGVSLWLETGVCIVNDSVIQQRDLYLYYDSTVASAALELVAELVRSLKLILVEPDLECRIQMQQGGYHPENTFAYHEETMWGGIWAYMSWLIYVVNAAWARYLDNPTDRRVLRQLRVRLRWLRSLLSFFRPVFKQHSCRQWQERLKNSGAELGGLRELDVVLLSLENLSYATPEEDKPKGLQTYFSTNREKYLKTLTKNNSLSKKTLELATLVVWLHLQPLQPKYTGEKFTKLVNKRLGKWNSRLLLETKNKEVLKDMKRAHALRIRIKKMRYVLLSLENYGSNYNRLSHQLKRWQDLLGIMHDDYTNGNLVRKLKTVTKDQRAEVLLFSGWESAKVESSQSQLEDLWKEFGQELKEWGKSLSKQA